MSGHDDLFRYGSAADPCASARTRHAGGRVCVPGEKGDPAGPVLDAADLAQIAAAVLEPTTAGLQELHEQRQADDPEHDRGSCFCCCLDCDVTE